MLSFTSLSGGVALCSGCVRGSVSILVPKQFLRLVLWDPLLVSMSVPSVTEGASPVSNRQPVPCTLTQTACGHVGLALSIGCCQF